MNSVEGAYGCQLAMNANSPTDEGAYGCQLAMNANSPTDEPKRAKLVKTMYCEVSPCYDSAARSCCF